MTAKVIQLRKPTPFERDGDYHDVREGIEVLFGHFAGSGPQSPKAAKRRDDDDYEGAKEAYLKAMAALERMDGRLRDG